MQLIRKKYQTDIASLCSTTVIDVMEAQINGGKTYSDEESDKVDIFYL